MTSHPEPLSLFEDPAEDFKRSLHRQVSLAADRGIYFGTSSWKYEGWLGQVYTPDRYSVRGRFSKKRFDQECLAEYAETFPTVCGDLAFYQFPSPRAWNKLFALCPSQWRFSFKVPEEITAPVFAKHARYGARGGSSNPMFLDRQVFEDLFLKPLEPFAPRIAVLILEFGAVCGERFEPGEFVKLLQTFMAGLPTMFRYAVEVRNAEFLKFREYTQMLKANRVSHVLNAWSKMPVLREQLQVPDIFTSDVTVVRFTYAWPPLRRCGTPILSLPVHSATRYSHATGHP